MHIFDYVTTMSDASRLLGLATLFMAASGCMSVQPSEQQLIGKWRVVMNCGVEDLNLKADSSYVQDIQFADGGHATHAGIWRVKPKDRFVGEQVVLQDAITFCPGFGDERLAEPGPPKDRYLETIWEWGHTILSFNPDVPGFERE